MNSNSPNLSGILVRKIAGVTDALSKVRAGKDAGTLPASPESGETSEYFKATREETVELPDGTEAKLRYMEPTLEGGSYGPFWEGSFETQGYTYTLNVLLADSSGDVARRALSTMVVVPDEGSSDGIRRGAPMRTLH
jgi:hypothetical protein